MKKLLIFAVLLALLCSCAQADTLYRTLEVGSVGDDVQAMKERLRDLGYYGNVKLNGAYNDSVAGVVRQFQYDRGLLMTGEADPYTLSALYGDGSKLPPEGAGGDGQYRALSEGAYGDDVLAFKQYLLKQGYYKSNDFNNQFNVTMTQRVQQYQADNGLTADGVVSPELQLAVFGPRAVSVGGVAAEFSIEMPELD